MGWPLWNWPSPTLMRHLAEHGLLLASFGERSCPIASGGVSARGLFGGVRARAVDLVLAHLVCLRERLVDVGDPALLKQGHDPGASRREHILDVRLDLMFVVVVKECAG